MHDGGHFTVPHKITVDDAPFAKHWLDPPRFPELPTLRPLRPPKLEGRDSSWLLLSSKRCKRPKVNT